jgi:hypothetical protein
LGSVLTVLTDSTNEEHDSMEDWPGGGFDPKAFDPSEFAENLKNGPMPERKEPLATTVVGCWRPGADTDAHGNRPPPS